MTRCSNKVVAYARKRRCQLRDGHTGPHVFIFDPEQERPWEDMSGGVLWASSPTHIPADATELLRNVQPFATELGGWSPDLAGSDPIA
jgi:hypothetical protein